MGQAIRDMQNAMAVMYEPMESIEKRFPGKKGIVLLDAVQAVYRNKDHVGATITFYDEHGNRNFMRHELNHRVQKSVETRYANLVMTLGCIPGVRIVGQGGLPRVDRFFSTVFAGSPPIHKHWVLALGPWDVGIGSGE